MKKISPELISKVIQCRGCKGMYFKKRFNLGNQPPANSLLAKEEKDMLEQGYYEHFFPLQLMECQNCLLLQLTHVVNPDVLFGDYLYTSSVSPVFIAHFQALAEKEMNSDRIKKDDLVVDIGSNDGILLKPFKELGAKVLGVDPAKDIAIQATKDGIDTIPEYFTLETAKHIAEKIGRPKLITATNVFAHVDDLDEIIYGVKWLLDDNGRFMVEVAYMPDMIRKHTFDIIYHEHLCYWSINTLQRFFARHKMYIDEVEFVPVHGGSIRVYAVMKNPGIGAFSIPDSDFVTSRELFDFEVMVERNKILTMDLLKKLKKQKKKIIGYGAPAKMSTLTNYYDIGPSIIDWIIDDAPEKQGRYSPGKHIKIVPNPEYAFMDGDYMFIFAWNFAESIMERARKYGFKGQFIIPFPKVRIV